MGDRVSVFRLQLDYLDRRSIRETTKCPQPRDVIFTRDRRPAHSLKWKSARGGDGTTPEGGTSRSRSSAAPRWPLGTLWARSGHETPQRIVDRRPRYPLTRWFIVSSRAYRPQHANACAHSPQKWPLTRTFCGARWNRTIGLSIISAAQTTFGASELARIPQARGGVRPLATASDRRRPRDKRGMECR